MDQKVKSAPIGNCKHCDVSQCVWITNCALSWYSYFCTLWSTHIKKLSLRNKCYLRHLKRLCLNHYSEILWGSALNVITDQWFRNFKTVTSLPTVVGCCAVTVLSSSTLKASVLEMMVLRSSTRTVMLKMLNDKKVGGIGFRRLVDALLMLFYISIVTPVRRSIGVGYVAMNIYITPFVSWDVDGSRLQRKKNLPIGWR